MRLTMSELVNELLPRCKSFAGFAVNVFFGILLWGVSFPLYTNWWVCTSWCIATGLDDVDCAGDKVLNIFVSLEELAVKWYNGIINICVIVAASVVMFEIAQFIYRELEAAFKAHHSEYLPHQITQCEETIKKYEDVNRENEERYFAIADYESIKVAWDEAKKKVDHDRNEREKAGDVFGKEISIIQRLLIEQKYVAKILAKLKELSKLKHLEHFTIIIDSYSKLDEILSKRVNKLRIGIYIYTTIYIYV